MSIVDQDKAKSVIPEPKSCGHTAYENPMHHDYQHSHNHGVAKEGSTKEMDNLLMECKLLLLSD